MIVSQDSGKLQQLLMVLFRWYKKLTLFFYLKKCFFCLVYSLFSLSEWDVIEWSDDQAIFTFLYDTVELTITFGEPVGE